MTQEALKKMYQLLLTEPHAPTVCAQLERIAREALAEHAMRETQKLGQEIEQCQCTECQIKPHASDCAVHSEPAYPKGKCDCGAQTEQEPVAECPNLKGKSMNKDEALTLEALKFAASKGYGRIVHDMKITPFTIKYEEALAQPEQEPVVHDPLPRACNLAGVDYQTFLKIKAYMPVAPPQRTEQNFCPRCGKRTKDIHTCTPPRGKA